MIIKNEEGFINLMEAVILQAQKDTESSNKEIREDAEQYLEIMKKSFS